MTLAEEEVAAGPLPAGRLPALVAAGETGSSAAAVEGPLRLWRGVLPPVEDLFVGAAEVIVDMGEMGSRPDPDSPGRRAAANERPDTDFEADVFLAVPTGGLLVGAGGARRGAEVVDWPAGATVGVLGESMGESKLSSSESMRGGSKE